LLLMLNEHDSWIGHQRQRWKTSPDTLKALAFEQLVRARVNVCVVYVCVVCVCVFVCLCVCRVALCAPSVSCV
jgi:hypothetical protein